MLRIRRSHPIYFYKEDLINLIVPDKPDPSAAKVMQETLADEHSPGITDMNR